MLHNSPELSTILQSLADRETHRELSDLKAGHASLKERVGALERMVTLGFWALVAIASGQSGTVVETLLQALKAKAVQ